MQPTLTLPHGVELDEFGVYHGLEMACSLMEFTFPFIAPYAHGDATVARKLFCIIAAQTLDRLLREVDAEGTLPVLMATIHPPGPQRRSLCEGHLAASVHETLRLLQQADLLAAGEDQDQDDDCDDEEFKP